MHYVLWNNSLQIWKFETYLFHFARIREPKDLVISSAKEIECSDGKSTVVLFVPPRLLPKFHEIQTQPVRELEKKFFGEARNIHAQRRILHR